MAPPWSPSTMVQVGEPWMPILCSIECARMSLRSPGEPSALSRNFGTRNSEMPRVPARRVGQPRQHEMHDVVGHVVLAIGDEDLLPGDAIAAVGRTLGARAQRADVGAGLRLGELHGAGPFAGRRAWADRRCLSSSLPWAASASIAPMVRSGPRPNAMAAEFHISRQATLTACGRSCPPHCSGAASPFQPAAAQAR